MDVNRKKRGYWLGLAGYAIAMVYVFGGSLFSLAVDATRSELESHILLIPFISSFLIYSRRKQLPREYSPSAPFALPLAVVGLAALGAAEWLGAGGKELSQNDFLALTSFSFLSLLAAGGFLFLGSAWMASAAFPVAFLIFMVPLPDAVASWMETTLKHGSAEVANFFFAATATPVLRDGVVFQLPGIVIEVAQECSGIRSTWVLLITSVLASHLYLKSPWRRAILVAAVIPLGLLRNGFRILVIGVLCIHWGPRMIHSIIHRQGGPFFFALSLIPFLILLWWLRRSEARFRNLDQGARAEDSLKENRDGEAEALLENR